MHVGEVVLHDVVRSAVGDGSEPKGRLLREWVSQSPVLHAAEVGEFLPGDHEGGQVGRVDGQKDQGEHGPDVSHASGSVATGAVHVHSSLKNKQFNLIVDASYTQTGPSSNAGDISLT